MESEKSQKEFEVQLECVISTLDRMRREFRFVSANLGEFMSARDRIAEVCGTMTVLARTLSPIRIPVASAMDFSITNPTTSAATAATADEKETEHPLEPVDDDDAYIDVFNVIMGSRRTTTTSTTTATIQGMPPVMDRQTEMYSALRWHQLLDAYRRLAFHQPPVNAATDPSLTPEQQKEAALKRYTHLRAIHELDLSRAILSPAFRPDFIRVLIERWISLDEKIGECMRRRASIMGQLRRQHLITKSLHRKINEDKYKCTICMDAPIDYVTVPCGHTFCGNCADRLRSRCFICNDAIQMKHKLFILGVAGSGENVEFTRSDRQASFGDNDNDDDDAETQSSVETNDTLALDETLAREFPFVDADIRVDRDIPLFDVSHGDNEYPMMF